MRGFTAIIFPCNVTEESLGQICLSQIMCKLRDGDFNSPSCTEEFVPMTSKVKSGAKSIVGELNTT